MRADAEANRRVLLTVAARMIATQGADVSLRSIAEAAGVGIGTLYRHFASRDELIIGLVQSIFGEVDRAAADFRSSGEPLARRWRGYVITLAALDLGALATSLSAGPRPVDIDDLLAVRERTMAGIDAVLAVVRAGGIVGEGVTALRFLLGVIQFTRPLPADAPAELFAEQGWLLDTYLNGLKPE